MNTPLIVSMEEWEVARQRLLVKEEEELTRARDALPPNADGCRGWQRRRTMCSLDRRASRPCSTCSPAAGN
jgi:hypothetical protein